MIHNLLLSHEYRYSWGLCSMTLIVPLLLMGEVESTGCIGSWTHYQTSHHHRLAALKLPISFFLKFLFVQNYALPHFLWAQATWRTFRICQALQSVLFFFLLLFSHKLETFCAPGNTVSSCCRRYFTGEQEEVYLFSGSWQFMNDVSLKSHLFPTVGSFTELPSMSKWEEETGSGSIFFLFYFFFSSSFVFLGIFRRSH